MIAAVIGFPVAFLLSWFIPKSPDIKQWERSLHTNELDTDKKELTFQSDDLLPDLVDHPDRKLETGSGKNKVRVLSMSSLIVIAAAAVLFLFYSGKSVPFQERGWILITDFENNTDEEIFDNSLNTAFALSINQSRHINVITRQRMFETLKRMKITDLSYIDEETGREIALREGVEVCIIPSISRVGSQYILTVRIQDTKSGTIFRSEVLYARGQEEILKKLDQLTKKIRRNLGESRFKISGQNKPLYEVTTSSLDALKQFSLGYENQLNMEFEKAVRHYENAIRIDSGFTSAKAALGSLHFERFDREQGRKWLDQVILSVDDLTDHEKYSILAIYAFNIENNLEKCIEYTKTTIELYPDDPISYNNLGWFYQQQGHYGKAIEEYKAAIRIDPNMMLSLSGIVWIYLDHFGQFDSAMVWSQRMIEAGPDNPWGHYYLGSIYVVTDNLEKAAAEYSKARDLDPNMLLNQYRLAHVYRLQGRYDQAIETLEDILNRDYEQMIALYNIGINYKLMGDIENARNIFLRYETNAQKWIDAFPENPFSYITNGLALAQLGEREAGWEVGKKGIELDSTLHFHIAELFAALDRKNEALDQLGKILENGYKDLAWIKLNPHIHLLREEIRYRELIKKYFN
jgi:tetratricopeptide (TPR) repeat protein